MYSAVLLRCPDDRGSLVMERWCPLCATSGRPRLYQKTFL